MRASAGDTLDARAFEAMKNVAGNCQTGCAYVVSVVAAGGIPCGISDSRERRGAARIRCVDSAFAGGGDLPEQRNDFSRVRAIRDQLAVPDATGADVLLGGVLDAGMVLGGLVSGNELRVFQGSSAHLSDDAGE